MSSDQQRLDDNSQPITSCNIKGNVNSNYLQNNQYVMDPSLHPCNISGRFPSPTYITDYPTYAPEVNVNAHYQPAIPVQSIPTNHMLAAAAIPYHMQALINQNYIMNLAANSAAHPQQLYASPHMPVDWSYVMGKNMFQPQPFTDCKQVTDNMHNLTIGQPPTLLSAEDGARLMFVNNKLPGHPSWFIHPQWQVAQQSALISQQPRFAMLRSTPRWPPIQSNLPVNGNNYQSNTRQFSSNEIDNGEEDKHESSILKKIKNENNFNPQEFDMTQLNGARFFIIKSYSEDDIHRSIKYGIWCSTQSGNRKLNDAYRDREGKGAVYLFFSVNESSHFCGIAEMMSPVDYEVKSGVWVQDKWQGKMDVRWLYIKDVPNGQLRHIHLENNGNRPVTFSRDAQEVPFEKARQVFEIIHNYNEEYSLLDDFDHYEQRQKEQLRIRRNQQKQQQFIPPSRQPRPPCEYLNQHLLSRNTVAPVFSNQQQLH